MLRMMKGLLFLLFLFSFSVCAEILTTEESTKTEYEVLRKSRFALIPHKNNYILPYVYNWMPHEGIYSAYKKAEPDRGEFYRPQEAEFQFSFALPVVNKIKDRDWDVLVAYTQHSWWQIYNADWSRPFRETNYQPEIFSRYIYSPSKDWWIFKLQALDAGYMHQSNGQIQEFSRSWDRLFARGVFTTDYFKLLLTGWYRLYENPGEDQNRHITDYMGYGEAEFIKKVGKATAQVKLPVFAKYFGIDVKMAYPLNDEFLWFLSYQSGYGQSLIEFDKQTQRLGLGFTLNNLFY